MSLQTIQLPRLSQRLTRVLYSAVIVGILGTLGCFSAPTEEADHHDPDHLPESFAIGVERLRVLYTEATGDESLAAVESTALRPNEADLDPTVHAPTPLDATDSTSQADGGVNANEELAADPAAASETALDESNHLPSESTSEAAVDDHEDHEPVTAPVEADDLWGWLPDLAAETDLGEAEWNAVRDATRDYQQRADTLALSQLTQSPEARTWWHQQLERLIPLANQSAGPAVPLAAE